MLRGVNKRIIEISDTGSELFEKAFFIVKNDNDLSESSLENEANRIMLTYFNRESQQPRMGFLRYTDLKKQRRKTAIITISSILLVLSAVSACLYLF